MLKSLICLLTLASTLLVTSLTANAQINSDYKNHSYTSSALYKHDPKSNLECRIFHPNAPWCPHNLVKE